MRRMNFRNERALYKRKCDLCGQDIISMYSGSNPYKIYCSECWFSDKWDQSAFGKNYNFNKPFLEQLQELGEEIPRIALFNKNNVNCPWVIREIGSKNCYLNVGGIENQDSAYNIYAAWGKDVFDNDMIVNSELCYENVFCRKCYKAFFSKLAPNGLNPN